MKVYGDSEKYGGGQAPLVRHVDETRQGDTLENIFYDMVSGS